MDIVLNKELKKEDNLFFKKIKTKSEIVEDCDGFLIDSDESEIRRILDVLKAKKIKKIIAIEGKDDVFNRRIIETVKADYLVSPEKQGKDTLKQRGSGLNHVLAKAAVKNNISIVINLGELNRLDKKEKAKRLARIMQNIVICRKAGCKIKIANFAEKNQEIINEHDRKALLFSLGSSSQQVRDSCGF